MRAHAAQRAQNQVSRKRLPGRRRRRRIDICNIDWNIQYAPAARQTTQTSPISAACMLMIGARARQLGKLRPQAGRAPSGWRARA